MVTIFGIIGCLAGWQIAGTIKDRNWAIVTAVSIGYVTGALVMLAKLIASN